MGWGRSLLFGNLGTQMNVDEVESDLASVYEHLRRNKRTDDSQDEAIQGLKKENLELKVYLAMLVRLLVRKGTVSEAEIGRLVELIEKQ